MNPDKTKPAVAFTPREIRAFKISAVVSAAIAAGMFTVAPKGLGQILGVLFAAALLPVPPVVVYLLRQRDLNR
jgi:hypothetical protein